ncbi:serine/threonine-protein kinase [Streptomyces sp. NPDC060223]|uniref:serine/threonine-protein kinase n=1 Tax=unclassified Streptomyces TaxID=2593676 RepID=UPI003642E9BC
MHTWTLPGYVETRELGAGASGRVVMAVDPLTNSPVAIKYLNTHLTGDATFLNLFRAESSLLRGLDSPHVVRLYDYVETAQGAAMVMELVDGPTLRALLRHDGATTVEAALGVLKGSLLGLVAAHTAGVVHRDYKPENVLVTAEGTSKLVDFGIAARDGSTPTTAGTPLYMAPEQWRGRQASPATDVYAATVTFFECLTDSPPFRGENLAEISLKHLSDAVPVDLVPEPVQDLVRRGMAKSPEDRYSSAEELLIHLEEVAERAYGADWEERGHRDLAAAALLLFMLPEPSSTSEGDTTFATTTVSAPPVGIGAGGHRTDRPRRGGTSPVPRRVLLATGAVLATVGLVSVAVMAQPAPDRANAESSLSKGAPSSSAEPAISPPSASGKDGSPTASASSPASSSSPSAPLNGITVSPEAEPGQAGQVNSGEADTEEPPPPVAAPAGAKPAPSSSAPSPLAVTSLEIGSMSLDLSDNVVSANVTLTATSAEPITVTFTWYTSDTKDTPETPHGAAETVSLSGHTTYSMTVDHAFGVKDCSGYWGLSATTSPAAPSGSAYQDVNAVACTWSGPQLDGLRPIAVRR